MITFFVHSDQPLNEERNDLPPIPNLIRGDHILLPPQRDPIACMEREHDIVLHIGDPAAAVGAQRNGVVELLVGLNVCGE